MVNVSLFYSGQSYPCVSAYLVQIWMPLPGFAILLALSTSPLPVLEARNERGRSATHLLKIQKCSMAKRFYESHGIANRKARLRCLTTGSQVSGSPLELTTLHSTYTGRICPKTGRTTVGVCFRTMWSGIEGGRWRSCARFNLSLPCDPRTHGRGSVLILGIARCPQSSLMILLQCGSLVNVIMQ